MRSTHTVRDLLPDSPLLCRVIERLFSPAECQKLLPESIRSSFQKASTNYPTYYRNNDRCVVDDAALAARLLERAAPYLPPTLPAAAQVAGESVEAWQLLGVNSRIRYCRYAAGQYFHRHLDGVHYASATVQSRLTFMVYLNDASAFGGGRTLFYRDKDDPKIWAEYHPQQGDLIVFDHNLWHEGEELTAGEKYVLRSDLLYQQAAPPTADAAPPYTGDLGYIWQLCAFGPDVLLSAGRDKTIRVWDAGGHCRQELRAHDNSILALAALGADTFVSAGRDQRLNLWQRSPQSEFKLTRSFHTHQAAVLSVCRLDDHNFASSGGDHLIHVTTDHGTVLRTLRGHSDWVWQVLPVAGDVLASASEDGTVRIWHWPQAELLTTLPNEAAVLSLAYDAPRHQLISGDLHGKITLQPLSPTFAPAAGPRRFLAHRGLVRTLLPLPNDLLASGGEDNVVRVWHLLTGKCLAEFQHQNFVQALALSPGGKLLSASYDGTIKSWSLPTATAALAADKPSQA